ncbi:cryptochrome/photolyase family protein [Pseudoalteromonas sp. CO302Y]|uniref:cryptochrome/photolyase family protein n=1 Tax=unclassified Pseudoalteromonas TaxID=194690 RepID=UPI0010234086|nr:cryptochrome/photolyase family protein [Pseudoalteromonas sp. CO302Y]RZG09970.1 cryptochrome/photolyase family protein [Pseudoalteromonas sp. CO133X]
MVQYSTLRFIFGDQLNASHSWFKEDDQQDVLYVLAELKQETDYVKHHLQKIAAFFAAMENFACALKKAGFNVLHLTLDETSDSSSLPTLLTNLAKQYHCQTIEYQFPDEYRLKQQLLDYTKQTSLKVNAYDTEHFLLPFNEIPQYFKKDKHVKMEFFYRAMRKRFNILMDKNNEPIDGQWNFDQLNRNKLKQSDLKDIPEPLCFCHDVSDILKRIEKHKINTFGECNKTLIWPTTRSEAKQLLDFFCKHLLVHFGQFQDAMTCQSDYQWSLYHSRLSFALNTKMLHPMQVIEQVLSSFKKQHIDIAQVEGFIRQILGWREYVRGIYWQNMPDYASKNTLNAKRTLPDYFWHGKTNMNCMHHAITQSLQTAYAHHIQRLMITGNFCLLTAIDPNEVDAWYLGIYIDAIEWVEMPNTRGMSQFADGGLIATKPYAASGNYINKMSDYCKHCSYNVKEKETDDACPFNSLYWHFMLEHEQQLSQNPRIGMIYNNWYKQDESLKQATLKRAKWCLDNLEKL